MLGVFPHETQANHLTGSKAVSLLNGQTFPNTTRVADHDYMLKFVIIIGQRNMRKST